MHTHFFSNVKEEENSTGRFTKLIYCRVELFVILVIVLTKASPAYFVKWSGEYFLK